MNDAPPVRGIVLAHGAMAGGLVDAALRISGITAEALVAVSNDGKSPDDLQEELSYLLGKGPALIFTDLPSGSCAVTARICCRKDGTEAVISGVNLPILLDFVFNRELPLGELVPRLVEKGRGSIEGIPHALSSGS